MNESLTNELQKVLFLPSLKRGDFVRRFRACIHQPECLKEMLEWIEHVYQCNESEVDGFSRLALLLFDCGENKQAQTLWERDLTRRRISWWQKLRYAECLAEINGIDDAIKWVSCVYSEHPDARNGYASLGWLIRGQQPEEACSLFEMDAQEHRLTPGFRLNYAVFCAEKGDITRAVQLVEVSYEQQPDLVDGHARVAQVVYSLQGLNSLVDDLYLKDAALHRLSAHVVGIYLGPLLRRHDFKMAMQFLRLAKPFEREQPVNACLELTKLSIRICTSLVRMGLRQHAMKLYREVVVWSKALDLCLLERFKLADALLQFRLKQDAFYVVRDACPVAAYGQKSIAKWCDLMVLCGQIQWMLERCDLCFFPKLSMAEAQEIRQYYASAVAEDVLRREQESVREHIWLNNNERSVFLFGYFQQNSELVISKRMYFERLATALKEQGFRLHVFDYAYTDVFNTMRLPVGCSHTSVKPIQGVCRQRLHCSPVSHIRPLKKIAALKKYELGELSSKDAYSEALADCLYTEQKIYNLIENGKPNLVLYWNPYLVYSRLVKRVCDELCVKSLVVESNVLPGFVEFDRDGCLGQSALSRIKTPDMPLTTGDRFRVEQYKQYSKGRILFKKHAEQQVVQTRKQDDKGTVLFFAGSANYGAGLVPRESIDAMENAPYFSDDREVLKYLMPIVKKNHWTLLFKPHPFNADDQNITYDGMFSNVSGMLRDCLSVAKVVITQVSSVACSALLMNKPVVLLGVNALRKTSAVNELTSRDGLENEINKAINYEFSASQRLAFDRFIHFVMTSYAFPLTQEIEAISGRSVSDAAQWLVTEIDCSDK